MKTLQKTLLAIAITLVMASMVIFMCAIAVDPQYSEPKSVILAVLIGVAGIAISYLLSFPVSRIQKVLDAEESEKAAKKAAKKAEWARREREWAEVYALTQEKN